MPRFHSSSSSSGSSHHSHHSDGSTRTYQTDATSYSDQSSFKQGKHIETHQEYLERSLSARAEVNPRVSVETYASTIDLEDDLERKSSGPEPRERSQCYAPDAIPSTSKEFAMLFPSTKRLLIQHDDTTVDGNMNLRVDTEVTTSSGRRRKLTLFHLKMKDLREREFSVRRYCRESGREVASCKRNYVKSTSPMPKSQRSLSRHSLSGAMHRMSLKPVSHRRHDSGYNSADDDVDDEDERQMEERLNVLTAPSDQVITQATSAIRLEFSNYAQVTMERIKTSSVRGYEFEYWGDMYLWRREKHLDEGELVVSYDLINGTTSQKVAIVMPDALSPQEEQWESKQGGWVPASSMRILRSDISDDLGDVIVATGLIALADDSMRQHFQGVDRRR